MSRTGEGLRRWGASGIALLCLVTWLGTAAHLALEPHDHHFTSAAIEHDHDDDHQHGHDHEHPAGESHDADDHRIAATSRSTTGVGELLALVPAPTCIPWESCATTPPPAPPRDDTEPTTDPPSASRRPRAPPVG